MEKDTGLKVNVVAQGTGQAINTAKDGNADVMFVHSKADEVAFVKEGYGAKRIEVMYNYFVIVGPKEDPAGVRTLPEQNKDAGTALEIIRNERATFVSRGDDSGTHKKELKLWESKCIGIAGDQGPWYVSAGKGMGDVLTMTSEMKGYTLTDKATFLSMKDKLDLEIVLEESQDLLNQYTLIAVSQNKYPDINKAGADKYIEWMTSEKGLKMIGEYGKTEYGENLFTVNYKE
jgi:tungstate transport system substrate-binding protein